jgi:hypothetical protein
VERNVCLRTLVRLGLGLAFVVAGLLIVRASWWIIVATVVLVGLWWAL